MNPQEDNQGALETVKPDALCAMFADHFNNDSEMPADEFDLFQPKTVDLEISRETRLSAAWALWSAGAGLSQIARKNERKRHRPELENLPV